MFAAACVFVIMYLDVDGLPARYKQWTATCGECSALVAAYSEAGPPRWLGHQTTVTACMRSMVMEQEA